MSINSSDQIPKDFVPRRHQEIISEHIISHPRCAIWVPMGFGKSAAALDALIRLSLIEDIFPVLIIAPLRVAQSTWPDEIVKWTNFEHLTISVLTGTPETRQRNLKKKADIYTINFENIPWLVGQCGKDWPFKTIIVDEARKLKGFRSRQGTTRTKALAAVAFRSPRFIELTGTPAPGGIEDCWGQLYFLDKGARLGHSYSAFMNRWFTKGWDGYSYTPMEHAQQEIEERIKDICLSLPKDYFPTDAPIEYPVYVDLPSHAREKYKEMEQELFTLIKTHAVEAVNAAVKTQKCLQFANGCAYTDDKGSYVEIHNEKIEALKSIVEETGGSPLLVSYLYKSDLARLQKAFPRAKTLDKDPRTIKKWNSGAYAMLLAHPASAAHGLDLQHSCNTIVYYSVDWDLELHQQILERVGPARQKQSGYDRPVFVYYILTRDTIDEGVLERLKTKKSIQDCLLNAMRRA